MKDSYYSRPEVSNSDLSALWKYLHPDFNDYDPTEAFRFGNLVDAMITEKSKLDYYKRTVSDYEDEPFAMELWHKAEEMKKACLRDPFCKQLIDMAEFQKIFIDDVHLRAGLIPFTLRMRCKFDLWMPVLKWGGDIKSTTCTTQKQFEEACRYFDYERQRTVYMLLAKSERDVLIGISKENFKIFKVTITRDSDFFKSGLEKLTDLGFKYWTLFENFNIAA
jgi:hypothetical protein